MPSNWEGCLLIEYQEIKKFCGCLLVSSFRIVVLFRQNVFVADHFCEFAIASNQHVQNTDHRSLFCQS